MAADIRATSHPYGRQGPSETGTAGSRGVPATVSVRRTVLADLTDELHALRAERDAIRAELVALRNLLTYAFGIDGWHVALSVRDRLASLATRLERRSVA